MLSVSPMAARRSAGTDACVIDRRMANQRLDAAEAFSQRHQLKAVEHRAGLLERADLERQHAAEAVRHLAPGERVLRVIGQARIDDAA